MVTHPHMTWSAAAGEQVPTAEVFDSCRHVVTGVLEGENGTILAYGQTGSGKTHTLIVSAARRPALAPCNGWWMRCLHAAA
jgi:DNA replication protein DnaC